MAGATCDNPTGNLANVNFAITSQTTWFQSLGGDVRFDQGLTNVIPGSVESSCAKDSTTGKGVVLSPGSTTSTGILYTGTTTPNVGLGLVSTPNYQVSGNTYGQAFLPVNATSLRTSYDYMLTSIKQQGQSITPLATHAPCSNLTNCTITNLSSGVYQADGSVKLVGFSLSVGTNRSIVILVNGFLQVNTPVDVPTGTSVVFIVSNDIYIDPSVGVTPAPASCNPTGGQLEGFYSTDKNFVIAGTNDCTRGADKILNIEGAIIANAALAAPTNTIKIKRSICGYSSYPAVTIRERPDMILGLSSILKVPTYTWQEVAP
jgi:hypothetical protein